MYNYFPVEVWRCLDLTFFARPRTLLFAFSPDQSNASTYNNRQVFLRKAKTNMADGVTQLCEFCNRLRLSLFWTPKLRNMPPVLHLILASLTGVAVALIATYIPSIWRPWFWRQSLESYAPGFNLVLAPQTALVEKSKLFFSIYRSVLFNFIACSP